MALANIDDVMAAVNQEIARTTLASVGGLFMLSPATNIQEIHSRLLGKYPLVPVFVFAGLLYSYAILALVIFVSSAMSISPTVIVAAGLTSSGTSKRKSAMQLAQVRLTDPLSLVAAIYGDRAQDLDQNAALSKSVAALSVKSHTSHMFAESLADPGRDQVERLHIGLADVAGSERPEFGIWKRRDAMRALEERK